MGIVNCHCALNHASLFTLRRHRFFKLYAVRLAQEGASFHASARDANAAAVGAGRVAVGLLFLSLNARLADANAKFSLRVFLSSSFVLFRDARRILAAPSGGVTNTLPGRLELPTLRLTASRSNQLSYGSYTGWGSLLLTRARGGCPLVLLWIRHQVTLALRRSNSHRSPDAFKFDVMSKPEFNGKRCRFRLFEFAAVGFGSERRSQQPINVVRDPTRRLGGCNVLLTFGLGILVGNSNPDASNIVMVISVGTICVRRRLRGSPPRMLPCTSPSPCVLW